MNNAPPAISVHLMAENYAQYEHIPSDLVTPLAGSLSALRASFEKIASAKSDIMRDTSLTEDGRLLALDQMFERDVISKVGKVANDLVPLGLTPAFAGIKRNELFKPSANPVDISIATEIRTRLASVSDTERHTILTQAAETGDKRTISAAMAEPSYLTGLNPELQAGYRDQYIARHHPELDALRLEAEAAARQAGFARAELERIRSLMFTAQEEARLQGIRARRAHAAQHLN